MPEVSSEDSSSKSKNAITRCKEHSGSGASSESVRQDRTASVPAPAPVLPMSNSK